MIKSIRLLNWRSHADTTLEFREGTNLLVGSMGSGKSSVMSAISFALFGTFPELERRKLRLQDLFRMNEDCCEVALEFAWDGTEYRIGRKLRKGKKKVDSEAEVFNRGPKPGAELKAELSEVSKFDSKAADNWKLVDSGPKAVTQYVEQLLAVDYDLFTRAIYSEQNNIDYFLTLDPRRRKQELDQLLGLDRFETARTNIVSVINRIKSNRKVLEQKFDPEQMQETRIKKSGQEREKQQMQEKEKELDEQEKVRRKRLSESVAWLSEMKKKKEQFEELSKERIRLESLSSQIKSDLEGNRIDEKESGKKKTELEEAKRKKEEFSARLKQTDSQLSHLSKQTGSLEARIKRITQSEKEVWESRKQLEELLDGSTPEQLEGRKDEVEKEAIGLFSEAKSLRASVEETEELLKNIKPGLSKCPLCDSQLGGVGTEKLISEKEKKIGIQKKRIGELEGSIKEKKRQFSELSAKANRSVSLRTAISNLEKEIKEKPEAECSLKELAVKMESASRSKRETEQSIQDLEKQIQSLSLETNKMEQLLRKQQQLEHTQEKLRSTGSQLAELDFDEKLFEAKREDVERSRIELGQITSEKSSIGKQVDMLSKIIGQMEKELENLGSMEKEIKRCVEIEEQLAIFRNSLLETQTTLRSDLTDAINAAMKEIWAIFYPYRNYRSIKLSVTEKDYLFEVLDNDEWKVLESIASGGERACAALTLRVALAMVLTPNLSWLILDEPTHNLDAEAINLLSETLQTRVPEVVKQTFVITHEEGLMGADFSASYRLSRDKSGSGPTKSELI